ncbi:class I SAM-dependent methyltransferase [Paludifilum halophilum]|nr:SAM-dependent methyltransferase [Paludifilum halophilum]
MNPLIRYMVDEMDAAPEKAIPFRRYMELALYHPRWGYYRRERPKVGRKGDFYTSPYVGDTFGFSIGRVISDMQKVFPPEKPWSVVEMGAGEGRLAEQILHFLHGQGVDPHRFCYYLMETSPYHREIQRSRLTGCSLPIDWIDRWDEIPRGTPSILISNELVDALPVHRVRMDENGELSEIYVGWDEIEERLTEREGPLTRSSLSDYFSEMGWRLEKGATAEVNLEAESWIKELADWLDIGFVLTVDYGGTVEELSLPARREGTLRGYRDHRLCTDIYQRPGETDLTSHVNFTALQRWGREAGLHNLLYTTQPRFLIQAGILEELTSHENPDPFSSEARRNRHIRQLIEPGGMGDAFRVLIQSKGVENPSLRVLEELSF